jgi:hypothetical protein
MADLVVVVSEEQRANLGRDLLLGGPGMQLHGGLLIL